MQPLAAAVVIPHPPHNSSSDSSSATQPHPRVVLPTPDHRRKNTAAREKFKTNVSTRRSTGGQRTWTCFPPNLRPAQPCLTPRDLATVCPSLFLRNSPHGDGRRQEAPLYIRTCLPLAWHGMDSGWRSGVARGEFCLSFTLSQCTTTVAVMAKAKHDRVFKSLVMSCEEDVNNP